VCVVCLLRVSHVSFIKNRYVIRQREELIARTKREIISGGDANEEVGESLVRLPTNQPTNQLVIQAVKTSIFCAVCLLLPGTALLSFYLMLLPLVALGCRCCRRRVSRRKKKNMRRK
jgi:hypothetical protein